MKQNGYRIVTELLDKSNPNLSDEELNKDFLEQYFGKGNVKPVKIKKKSDKTVSEALFDKQTMKVLNPLRRLKSAGIKLNRKIMKDISGNRTAWKSTYRSNAVSS